MSLTITNPALLTGDSADVARIIAGYVRRSKVDVASPGDVSRDTQTAAIRALAGDRANEVVYFTDFGISGRGKARHKRTEFGRLLDLIREDKVETVMAYNLSRLGRSVRDVLELAELSKDHGTGIVLSDGQVDANTATGRMMLSILSSVDEWTAESQAERSAGNLAAWRAANPDKALGRKPYGEDDGHPGESVADVLKAFDEAGSFLGAARLLTARAVPTRLGNPRWEVSSVSRIVKRHRAIPVVKRVQGRPATARHAFSGLLRCACGTTLTTMNGQWSPRYYCRAGHLDASHRRPYSVSERKVVRWAKVKLEHMRTIERLGHLPDADAVKAHLEELHVKRERIVDMYADGTLTKAQRDHRLNAVEADRAKVETGLAASEVAGKATLYMRPTVDWDAPADEVNTILQSLWSHVVMNGGQMPKRAVWHVTEDWNEEGPS